jgi:hypothetical protein
LVLILERRQHHEQTKIKSGNHIANQEGRRRRMKNPLRFFFEKLKKFRDKVRRMFYYMVEKEKEGGCE